MSSLEAQGLTKRAGKTTLIDNVSFSLQASELFVILGPPGSGKTLLLRLLAGLEEPDRGRVTINGADVTDLPAAQRGISMLFQNGYGLIPHMTVSENMALPLQHALISKNGAEYRIAKVAQNLRIAHLLERKISTLTDGERLHVALARAIVKAPSIYLFDDLFAHLDTPTRLSARRELVEIQQTLHLSCVFVTSDPEDAFALANRVAIVQDGKIQQLGTRAELINWPATLWVAQWLGFPPMNTLTGYVQGTYQPTGLCYRVWAKGFTPLLPARWTPLIGDLRSEEIILGVRPESIIPEWELQKKWKPSLYTLKGEILASEWKQNKTVVHLQFPHVDETFIAVFSIAHDQVKTGQILTVAFDPEDFCLFHPRTNLLLHDPGDVVYPSRNGHMEESHRRPLLDFLERRRSGPLN